MGLTSVSDGTAGERIVAQPVALRGFLPGDNLLMPKHARNNSKRGTGKATDFPRIRIERVFHG